MLIMKNGKRKITDGTELPNQERIRTPLGEKENYKYKGILEVDTIELVKMKEKISQTERENFWKSSLGSRNLTKGINTWVVPLVR